MIIPFILLLLGAFFLGSIPTAYLVGKWSRSIDIRQYGSGNIGATNVIASVSKKWGIPVVIFDLVKGMVMVGVAYFLELNITQQVAIGLAAIVGHNWSVFLRFVGGKGLLTTLGVVFFLPSINRLVPWEIIVFLIIAGISIFGFHNLPIGAVVGVTAMPLISWRFERPLALTLGFLAMFLVLFIRRLAVRRSLLAASLPLREIIVNRLLFDRDIRDRKVWLSKRPAQPER